MNEPLLAGNRDPTLPDFLIIGAQKAGTTALMMNLDVHPGVSMAGSGGRPRELHFFDQHWDRGLDWYRGFFDRSDRLQGEKTPDYFGHAFALERMARILPHARLVVSLRNPVDRAYSQWNHFNQISEESTAWGWRVESFEKAIARSGNMLIRYGEYATHLSSLYRFYPREQVHVVIAERLREKSQEEYDRLLRFLGLDPGPRPFRNHHEREYGTPMAAETREMLNARFAPLNEELFALLGARIDEWAEPVLQRRYTQGGKQRIALVTDRPGTSAHPLTAALVALGVEVLRFNVDASDLSTRLSSGEVKAAILDLRRPWELIAAESSIAGRSVVYVRGLEDEAQWRPGLFPPGLRFAAASAHVATRFAAAVRLTPVLARMPRGGATVAPVERDDTSRVLVIHAGECSQQTLLDRIMEQCPEIPFSMIDMATPGASLEEIASGVRLFIVAGPWAEEVSNLAIGLQLAGIPGVAAPEGGAAELLGAAGVSVRQAERPSSWAEALREVWHNADRWEERARAAMLNAESLLTEEQAGPGRLLALLLDAEPLEASAA
jgi:hypothetical protein